MHEYSQKEKRNIHLYFRNSVLGVSVDELLQGTLDKTKNIQKNDVQKKKRLLSFLLLVLGLSWESLHII